MKKSILIPFALLLLSAGFTQAQNRVWRVNNNGLVNADFSNLNTAVTSSSVNAGDTLYLEGSSYNYGAATISKRLVIIGTGYFLGQVGNDSTQWNKYPSQTSTITFAPGSKGSVIAGVEITGYLFLNDSLITVERDYLNFSSIYLAYAAYSFANDDTIRQSYMNGGIISQTSTSHALNVLVYNNVIGDGVDFHSNLANTSAYFINNDFVYPAQSFYCSNSIFQNNIINSGSISNGNTDYAAGNLFNYNIYVGTILDSTATNQVIGTGNVKITDITPVFAGWNSSNNIGTPATGYSYDNMYALRSGSPAIGAGKLNGQTVDCGIFGGPAPYILSGMPHIPSIYSLTLPTQEVTKGTTTLQISLKSAAH